METLIAIIYLAESLYGIPQGLLVSLYQVESNLNPYAVVERDGKSGRSSHGIGQMQLSTAQQFRPGISISELYNPVINSQIGAAYLAWQYKRYGSWRRAVVAYNRGASSGPDSEYSRKVMALYGRAKRDQVRAYRPNTQREYYAARSSQFLREDLAYAD